MITNIDDNVGRLRTRLEAMGIAENTIFIFTSDNGTGRGRDIYNAGMRGGKGSPYDGGHRVPFFLHWPGGGMDAERRIGMLTHVVDLTPTLLDLIGIEAPGVVEFDGLSIRPLLEAGDAAPWADRMVIVDTQRVVHPIKWRRSSVMAPGWRLISGEELYHLPDDPGQENDLSKQHPDRVEAMRAFYKDWWSEIEPTFEGFAAPYIGHTDAPAIVTLYPRDWAAHDDAHLPITQGHIRQAKVGGPSANPTWPIRVAEPGVYRIGAHRWPPEIDHPINEGLPPESPVPGTHKTARAFEGVAIPASEAVLTIDGRECGRIPVDGALRSADFTLPLEAGDYRINAHFILEDADLLNAYYLSIETIGE